MSMRVACLALLALFLAGAEALAQTPDKGAARPWSRWQPSVRPQAAIAYAASATVPESEPNNDAAGADSVNLGDQATGNVDPAGDHDWFVFSVTAGTIVAFDVDANQYGSPLDPYIHLYAGDGQTELANNDDHSGLDSYIEYLFETAGTYYLMMRGYAESGGTGYYYTINFRIMEPGPGDPVTTLAEGLGCPYSIAVADDGNLFVSDPCNGLIWQVTPAGTLSEFASLAPPLGMTFDAFGNLIVSSADGFLYRITPDGDASPIDTVPSTFAVTTGPDGSIWVAPGTAGPQQAGAASVPSGAPNGGWYLHHYNPFGSFVDSLQIEGYAPWRIAYSPAGQLHYSFADSIYKLVDGVPQAVLGDSECCIEDFAFDADGNIYVANDNAGRVKVFGPTGSLIDDAFAISVYQPIGIRFGRNADGAMNTQLYVTDRDPSFGGLSQAYRQPEPGPGLILALNPDGPDVPGDQVGLSLAMLAEDDVAAAVMGVAEMLSEGEMQFLDFIGNQNEMFDVGDFRAYLQLIGVITPPPALASPRGTSR